MVELLITMVVMSILGIALARLLINNSRFVARQDAMMDAREAARAAMNSMTAELRMVGDGGLLAASRDSVRFLLPYAFGMTCRRASGAVIGSLMPSDSLMYAQATPDGLAWRGSDGAYTMNTNVSVAGYGDATPCTADSVRVVPGGRLIAMTVPPGTGPDSTRLFYLFQQVSYRFQSSTSLPGRIGLWRQAGSGALQELVSPFDTAARFAFLTGPSLKVQTGVPASLDSVRGLDLRLTGASVATPPGMNRPARFDLRTRVTFLNKGK